MFPSGNHEKEQHCCTKNVQNYSKRKIKFGLTELSSLALPLSEVQFLCDTETLQKQTKHSRGVVICIVASFIHEDTKSELETKVFRILLLLESFVSHLLSAI